MVLYSVCPVCEFMGELKQEVGSEECLEYVGRAASRELF